jgi:hypothetical protein
MRANNSEVSCHTKESSRGFRRENWLATDQDSTESMADRSTSEVFGSKEPVPEVVVSEILSVAERIHDFLLQEHGPNPSFEFLSSDFVERPHLLLSR